MLHLRAGNATGVIVEKYLVKSRGVHCSCNSNTCDSVSCNLNKTSCWAGPKIKHLQTKLNIKKSAVICSENQYQITRQVSGANSSLRVSDQQNITDKIRQRSALVFQIIQ